MARQRKAKITYRQNKDGSTSVVCGGRVIIRHRDQMAIRIVVEGFREAEAERHASK